MRKQFPRRKLTFAEGEYMLWHAIEHLQQSSDYWHDEHYLAVERAMTTCRKLITEVQIAQQAKQLGIAI